MTNAARSAALIGLAAGCGDPEPEAPASNLSRAELLDPESCRGCHPIHFEQWQSSMHAYAADDPIFRAMNARGQRETKGQLGDFCVRCHAPMALAEGATLDGLNLDDLDPKLKGVTCYFCHNADAVEGDHNAPVRLANDFTMRAGIPQPVANAAHRSDRSDLLDGSQRASARLCGACHDIVTPRGVHLERTFSEWKDSLFGQDETTLTCAACHMKGADGPAARGKGLPIRRTHEHLFPGVDVALTNFSGQDSQRAAIARDLDPALVSRLCVSQTPGGIRAEVTLENFSAGHMIPSGASQDRRMWLELVARSKGHVVFESGTIASDAPANEATDPSIWLFRDRAFDEQDHETHMFWNIARVESMLLPPVVTADKSDPRYFHGKTRVFDIRGVEADAIETSVRLRPIDHDLIEDLVASGDLPPTIAAEIPTFTLESTRIAWTQALGFGCFP